MINSVKDLQKLFFSGRTGRMNAFHMHSSNYQIMYSPEKKAIEYKSGCGDFLAYYMGSYAVLSAGPKHVAKEREFLQTLIDMFKDLGFTGVKLEDKLQLVKKGNPYLSYSGSTNLLFDQSYEFHIISQIPPISWGIVYKFFYYYLRALHSTGQAEAVYQTYKVYKDTKDAYKAIIMFGIFNEAPFSTKFQERGSYSGTGFPDFALKLNSPDFIKEMRAANRNIQSRLSSSLVTWERAEITKLEMRARLRAGDYSFFEDEKYFKERERRCISLINTPDLKLLRGYRFKYTAVDIGYGRTKDMAEIFVKDKKSVREELSNIYITE